MNSQRLEQIVAKLMKPISDVRRNFDTDLSALLEEYLTEAGLRAMDVEEEEINVVVPNFTEVALLLQQSVCIYSKKVDFLYQHVINVSESLNNNLGEPSEDAPAPGEPPRQPPPLRPAPRRPQGGFVEVLLQAGAARRDAGVRPPPTLPRAYLDLEPRVLDARDFPLLDYDAEPVGLLADFHVTWRLHRGQLIDELAEGSDGVPEARALPRWTVPPSPPPPANPSSTDPVPGCSTTADPIPDDLATGDFDLDDSVTDDLVPGNSATDDPVPGNSATGDLVPGDPATGDPVPGDPATGDSVPGDPATGDPVPGDLATGDLIPNNLATGDLVPGNLATGDLVPGNLATGDLVPGNLATGDLVPGDPATGDSVPGNPATGDPVPADPVTGDLIRGDLATGDPVPGDPTTGANPAAAENVLIGPVTDPDLTPPKRKRKRRSRSNSDEEEVLECVKYFHLTLEARVALARVREFSVPRRWRSRVVAARAAELRALRRRLRRRPAGDLRGFHLADQRDIGGFLGWSLEEVTAQAAKETPPLAAEDAAPAAGGAGPAAGGAGGESEDDGFFERSSLEECDTSREDALTLAPGEPEWERWRARVLLRAAEGAAAGADVLRACGAVLRAAPAPPAAARFPALLRAAGAGPRDVCKVFLATLFLANAGNVEIVPGEPLALGDFSVHLLNDDDSLYSRIMD